LRTASEIAWRLGSSKNKPTKIETCGPSWILLLLQLRIAQPRSRKERRRTLEAGASPRSGKLKGNEMNYVDGTLISSDDQQAAGLKTVQEFLDRQGAALANAAYLLGGARASGTVFSLIEGIRNAQRLSKAHFRRLQALHALLVLENVGDPERLETALFVEIIPGSKAVDEICLLADALDDLLSSLGAGADNSPNRGGGDTSISEAA
jgi:hypothetical protein